MADVQRKQGTDRRLVGVVVPVGALRTAKSTGVGEFPDLAEFAALCRGTGIGLIQLLPVNDTGYESSPYGALTAFALHPLYLRIGDLPELAGSPGFAPKIEAMGRQFNGEKRFPFEKLIRAKMDLLREIYAVHKTEIAKKAEAGGSLAGWIEKNPWVKEYALFRRLKEANNEKSWQEWSGYRTVTARETEALWQDETLRGEHLFWVWIQEALDRQFGEAAGAVAGEGILLEGDLPILMNEDSCDVWAHPEYFHKNLSAGAPPDMYSPAGQNWGFPIYDWEAQEKDNFAWWRNRLKTAEKYYHAYRIDHVLGFFRIWAARREDYSSALGRYIPYVPVKEKDLADLGFDKGRIRWFSRPHIPTHEVWNALRDAWANQDADASEAERIFSQVLDRVGSEELWLFKDSIKGEKDIDALGFHPASRDYLFRAWHNRLFLEYEKGRFTPVWYFRESRAYASLSEEERQALEAFLEKRRVESEKIWEKQGERLLSILTASSSMLPCAEDLGAVPDCVPRVLAKLQILGLRVVRWFREWEKEGQPYIPLGEYPELSVCTPAVHDSSTLREWWEREADQEQFSGFIGFPSLPRIYNPGSARIILHRIAASASRFRVFQIQDLLHLSPKWYAADPASERINVPGTANDFNWTYRLSGTVEDIGNDKDFVQGVKDLCGE
jgi:4-alpha-glucanotransferase